MVGSHEANDALILEVLLHASGFSTLTADENMESMAIHPAGAVYKNMSPGLTRGNSDSPNERRESRPQVSVIRCKGGCEYHEPVRMTIRHGKGRVCHTVKGHNHKSMQGVTVQATLTGDTQWAAAGIITFPAVSAEKLPADEAGCRDPKDSEPLPQQTRTTRLPSEFRNTDAQQPHSTLSQLGRLELL